MKRMRWHGCEQFLTVMLPPRAMRLRVRREAEEQKARLVARLTAQMQQQAYAAVLRTAPAEGNA